MWAVTGTELLSVAALNMSQSARPMGRYSFSTPFPASLNRDLRSTGEFVLYIIIIVINFTFFYFSLYSSAVIAVAWHPSDYALASCDKTKRVVIWTDGGYN